MENEIIKMVVGYGVFAVLFVVMLWWYRDDTKKIIEDYKIDNDKLTKIITQENELITNATSQIKDISEQMKDTTEQMKDIALYLRDNKQDLEEIKNTLNKIKRSDMHESD